ncbi:MAG: helix-turn-helix transcriptional regulator [Lachnospiraceae bacterium]|nr:helix-turn-helix transcriptional regulator [Lachnospiraceae bacterium]
MNISERILQLRKQKRLSQEEMAKKLNVTRQAVSKWENSQSLPDIDNIIAMSKLLDKSTDFILHGMEMTGSNLQENKTDNVKKRFILPICLLVIALILSFSLPMMAKFYQGYEFSTWGTSYSDAYEYMRHFPLLGIVFITAGFYISGIFLLIKGKNSLTKRVLDGKIRRTAMMMAICNNQTK